MKKNLILLLFFLPGLILSQTLDWDIEKPRQLYIGTPFKINVNITTNPADSIFSPQVDTLDIFILADTLQSEQIIENQKKSKVTYIFQPFDTGKYTFPELEFTIKDEEGKLTRLKTEKFELEIASVITDTTETIKDIAAIESVNLTFWDIVIPLAVLAILIGIILLIKKHLKKNKKPDILPENIDTRPAYEIALEMLKNLKKKRLLEKRDYLNFHYELSFILRFFLEKHFGFNALEMTTYEIKQNLQLDDFKEKSEIIRFLNFADRIKFAKFIPDPKDSREAYDWLKQYLKKYKKRAKEKKIEENNNV